MALHRPAGGALAPADSEQSIEPNSDSARFFISPHRLIFCGVSFVYIDGRLTHGYEVEKPFSTSKYAYSRLSRSSSIARCRKHINNNLDLNRRNHLAWFIELAGSYLHCFRQHSWRNGGAMYSQ